MNHRSFLFFTILLGCLSLSVLSIRLKVSQEEIKHQFKVAEQLLTKAKEVRTKNNLGDMTVECGLCGIAVNEIEALLAENLTQQAIEQELEKRVCSILGGTLAKTCDELVENLPVLIQLIEQYQSVGVVCVELGFCQEPFSPHQDPQPIPQYVINLDLPPNQRWKEICSVPAFQNITQYLVNSVVSVLPDQGKEINYIGELLNKYYFPQEYAQEIQGCAQYLGVPYGWVTILNLGYEVSDACTSIVAQTADGKIYHARNLDFWDGMGFTDSLKDIAVEISFQKSGKTLFKATSFAGFVGVLSGFKDKAFSMTIDTRFYPDGISELFYEIIAAITEKNASLVTFLAREVMTNEYDFESAVANLSNDTLIADVYYIVAGVSAGQGVVISRNRLNAADVWRLDAASGRWFEVETNYDHWEQPPWYDDRVVPANNAMNAMGQSGLTLDGMFKVLSIKPVLNLQTTYTILSCPADGTYKSFNRYCPYPCAE